MLMLWNANKCFGSAQYFMKERILTAVKSW